MKKLVLSLLAALIGMVLIVLGTSIPANAWHWEKVEAQYNDSVGTTAEQLNGSTTQCHGFAIWEDTKTMEVDVYLGNTYTANVFYTKILVGEVLEINFYDKNLETTGIYVSTTDTAKVNYISRIRKGF